MKILFKTINTNENKLDLYMNLFPNKTDLCKGVVLYFHGGGLIYGNSKDLPSLHISKLCNAGYAILAIDYRLAPETKFPHIIQDVLDAINFFIKNRIKMGFANCPYFLWGRSAGAYLALLAASKDLLLAPRAIISYYGYGFLTPNWFDTSSTHYLNYLKIDYEQIKSIIGDNPITVGQIEKRYGLYIYGRQTGKWISMIYDGNNKEFLLKYSLKNITNPNPSHFPPVFLAHSSNDLDVPISESIELSKFFTNSILFTCSSNEHDFDRNTSDKNTIELLNKTIDFLNQQITTLI